MDEMGWPEGPIFNDVQQPEKDRISALNPKWSVRWQEDPGKKSLIVGCEVDYAGAHPNQVKDGRLDYWYRRFDPSGDPMAAMRWCAWAVAEAICHDPDLYGTYAFQGLPSIHFKLPPET